MNSRFDVAALTEPCCVAYNATVMNARICPGDRILVLGPGPIGILAAAMARLCGAEVAVMGLAARPATIERDPSTTVALPLSDQMTLRTMGQDGRRAGR